jgi:aminopeptidase N
MRRGAVPDWEEVDPGACYDLTLDLDPADSSYRGTAEVTLTNLTGAALPDLVFRTYPNSEAIYGGALEVNAVSVNGEPAEFEPFLDDRTAIRVPLSEPLAPGETLRVEMEFEGEITEDFGGLPSVYGVFNHNTSEEFISLANWYPILAQRKDGEWVTAEVVGTGDAVVSESALYRVRIDGPQGWEYVTTGSRTEGGDGDPGLYASGPVRDFIVLASTNFTESSLDVDGIAVRHWGLPGGEDRWDEALQATADSISVYNERFGEYPYAELDVVAAPLRNALGVEYPGVFLLGDDLYRDDPQRPFLLGLVVAHEAAHQWWYGVVGNDILTDPWQDEGLTTFSSTLYQEIFQPDYYEGTLEGYRETVDSVSEQFSDEELEIAQSVADFQEHERLYSPVVYQKGALFFQALREELGDEVFFGALKAYYEGNRYLLAPPEQLLDAFETVCGCELDEFYREWGALAE